MTFDQSPNAVQAAAFFAEDTTGFVVTVLHEEGEYRHLRFQAPGTRQESTDIHTAPGMVFTSGSMADGWMFERGLGFFEGKGPNLSYWGEKLTRNLRWTHKEFSPAILRASLAELVDEHINDLPEHVHDAFRTEVAELADEIVADAADVNLARQRVGEFRFEYDRSDLAFYSDELDVEDYSYHYVWACLVLNTVANWLRDRGTRIRRPEVTA